MERRRREEERSRGELRENWCERSGGVVCASVCVEGCTCNFQTFISVCVFTERGGGGGGGGGLSVSLHPAAQSRLCRARESITAATRLFMLINLMPFAITTSVPVIQRLHIVLL